MVDQNSSHYIDLYRGQKLKLNYTYLLYLYSIQKHLNHKSLVTRNWRINRHVCIYNKMDFQQLREKFKVAKNRYILLSPKLNSLTYQKYLYHDKIITHIWTSTDIWMSNSATAMQIQRG